MATWGPPCDSSNLTPVLLFGQTETVHRCAVEAFKYAELLALRTAYGRMLVARDERTDFQTYACRPIRGTENTWSNHSWARATDIRPSANPMREDGVLITDFDKFGYRDGLAFIYAFLDAGFRWGGTWSHDKATAASALHRNGQKVRDGRVDTMHFELDQPEPITDGWVRRLRAYRLANPRYMARVLRAADVKTCEQLVAAWHACRA